MKNHKRAYEQYCFVKGKNIVFEETVYHNGVKKRTCQNYSECEAAGGCQNEILYALIGENAVDGKESF